MDCVLHLHLGHHDFDMLLVCSQISNDLIISVLNLSDLVLDSHHLVLGRVLAVGDILVDSLDDLFELVDTVDDVLIVAIHQCVDHIFHALSEAFLVREAHRKRVKVLLLGEPVDQASCDASYLLPLVIGLVGQLRPRQVTRVRLLLGEDAESERLAGSLKLPSFVQLNDFLVGRVCSRPERQRFDLLQAVELSRPILRLPQQVENLERLLHHQVDPAHSREELAHILAVHEFKDSDRLSSVLDLFADEKFVQVVEALLGDEGVTCGPREDNLVVVGAVSEHFVRSAFFCGCRRRACL